jgi:hypothetical protein
MLWIPNSKIDEIWRLIVFKLKKNGAKMRKAQKELAERIPSNRSGMIRPLSSKSRPADHQVKVDQNVL